MKEQLIEIGFKETDNPKHLEFTGNGFSIDMSIGEGFWISTDLSSDRESAPYPYAGIDKLKALIKAHEEYFK